MSQRLNRKNKLTYGDIGYKYSGGIFDLIDNDLKVLFRINDEEYDYITMNATDEELGNFVDNLDTFGKRRKAIEILVKYLTEFENK